jgi:hypothetical protein
VGQVAVQKPQCTQVRRTWLLVAVSGSWSWAGEKFVCIHDTKKKEVFLF